MRRLVILLLAVIAATSAYNLVLQEFTLTGDPIISDAFVCDDIGNLHIGSGTYMVDCYEVRDPSDLTKLEARKIVYKGNQITTKASNINFAIVMKDGSNVTFTLVPQMKVGVQQTSNNIDGKWTSVAVDPTAIMPSTTTTTTAPHVRDCVNDPDDQKTPECICQDKNKKDDPACDETFCKGKDTKDYPACEGKPGKDSNAIKKTVPRPKHQINCAVSEDAHKLECRCQLAINMGDVACITFCADGKDPKMYPACRALHAVNAAAANAAGAATVVVEALPAIRLRGPGPVLPPIRLSPPVVSEEDEERRVKRAAPADPPTNDDKNKVSVTVSYYVLDEPGNPAAVWAAVIEGIILLLLVGACCYFFFWAPRARAAASATADPYKEQGPNYSVSYANSSFNQRNERIDAFQNPPAPTPAAPPRPANSAYMDDYITDNIGAMSRPGGTAQPAPAAAPAFEPRHQRFDSSGLVTVNLS